jgi:hypothetical protein
VVAVERVDEGNLLQIGSADHSDDFVARNHRNVPNVLLLQNSVDVLQGLRFE